MSKSLSTFMMVAAVVLIMVTLIIGLTFESLETKNMKHQEMLETEHQLKTVN